MAGKNKKSLIVGGIGGIIPFLFALVMFLILLVRVIKKGVRFDHLFLLVWALVTFLLSFTGNRFTMLFAIPAGILAGNLAGKVSGLLTEKKVSGRKVYQVVLPVLFVFILVFPTLYSVYNMYGLYRADAAAYDPEEDWGYRPLEESLCSIKEKTPKDTVLVSWWDFGYFLEEKGQRGTLFDGGNPSFHGRTSLRQQKCSN
ncbi:MAG: hypothetical protein IJJ13_06055 [Lachnospiraceae bacterium]|nr:hypothetical protein [Lachnospiraceae bacterium]